MQSTTLEINVLSARDLPEINLVSKMVVYVVVSLSGQKFKTNADLTGGINPNWRFPVKFDIDELAATQNQETLVFTVRCSRNLGDRDVGEVHVPVAELLLSAADRNSTRHVTYPVKKPSGKTHGVLNFEYKFGGNVVVGGSTASFHVGNPAAGYATTRGIGNPPDGYKPPQYSAGYPPSYPPPNPQPYSYGYPHNNYPPAPVVVEKEKKSGMGKIVAVGAALLGGLVCGALVGEMAAELGPPSYTGGNGGHSGTVSSYNSTLQSCNSSQNTLGQIG